MLQFPESTIVNKTVPKTAFYKHLEVSAKLKSRFVEDIVGINWTNKLAPSTLNIDNGKTVHEITVFLVKLKQQDTPDDVFLAIDRQMPRHVLFVLQYGERYRLLLNYKEWADQSKGLFNIVRTFRTAWLSEDALTLRIEGATMDAVYEAFAGQISGYGTTQAADTRRVIELQKLLELKRRAVEALQKKVRTERQFNLQMQLNTEARAMRREMNALQAEIDKILNKKQ